MHSIYEPPSNISLSLTTTYPFYIRPTFATVKPIIQIMDKKTIVVVGAGQGLGNHVAERFGKEGFRVVLMARGEQSLKAYAQEFAAKGIEAHTYAVDAARPETLTAALGQAKQQFGTPDVLIYNVGITAADDPAAMNSAELMRHYQIDVASAYDCVRQVATEEFAKKNGTVILTGGGLATHPTAGFIPLSLDKAALRTLAYILHDELKPQGIFVGTVTVCGSIGIDTYFAPAQIAETYWQMYKECGACEVRYEYPELKECELPAGEYWKKIYELSEKYK